MATESEMRPVSTAGSATPAPTKRKNNVSEIEVDLSAPEPPSKRARRALKKGKALPAKANSDAEDDDGDKDENPRTKEKIRSEHGIWLGNLPFFVTAAELRQWLVDNAGGVITADSITRIKLPVTKEHGRDKQQKSTNKGFAYVDFADVSQKVAAIALSETLLGGRKLLIKDAKSFDGRPAKETSTSDGPSSDPDADEKKALNTRRKVFVGNMSFKATEDDLRRTFEKCGEIEWVKVATFEDSGKCKGYGWIQFKEPEAASWAAKGFVKIREEVETEEDFRREKGQASDDDDAEKNANEKKFKTRKWWVNRLLGRELKLELAEDDQTRYKKRFGKDAPKTDEHGHEPRQRPAQATKRP